MEVKEASAVYLSQKGSSCPPGYKQTEVGVIPEDWEIKCFGEIAQPRKERIDPRRTGPQEFCVELEHIEQGTGRLIGYTATSKGSSQKSVFQEHDVLFGKLRAYLRKYWLASRQGVCSTELWVLVAKRSELIPSFLFQLVKVDRFIEVASSAYGTHMPRSDWNVVKNYQVRLPAPPEQETIAEALSDADALIESLEQLLAKKRHLKQGAMQELLTGKKRLPDFSGEWEVKRLGSTATLKARIGWQGLTTAEYLDSGDYYLVTGTEFKNGYIDWSNCHYVDESRYKQDKYIQLKEHDVLVTKDGTIGKVALITDLPSPATLNSGVFVIRPVEDAFHPEFFYYLLCSTVFAEFLSQLSAGSTINHLYQKDFVNFIYSTPATIEEQTAIAAILSDMDAEIAALEEKLAKARNIKQGMMQELLTGRIRLV
jgi:type I restriction enzyme S subunit